MALGIILIALAALVLYGAIAGSKQRKKLAEEQAAREAQWAVDPAAKAAYERDREQHKKYFSGKLVGGHPDIAKPVEKTNVEATDTLLSIFEIKPGNKLSPVLATIPVDQITNVAVEDATTVQKRVTATRLLTVGVFAFAAKKKEVHVQYYVTISWGAGKIGNETIFEFEGANAQELANALRNIVAKRVNSLPVAAA